MALECGKPQRMSVCGGARFQRQYAGHEVTEYTDDLRVMSSTTTLGPSFHIRPFQISASNTRQNPNGRKACCKSSKSWEYKPT